MARQGRCYETRLLGDSLTVELPTLTRTVLVRIQVPQPPQPVGGTRRGGLYVWDFGGADQIFETAKYLIGVTSRRPVHNNKFYKLNPVRPLPKKQLETVIPSMLEELSEKTNLLGQTSEPDTSHNSFSPGLRCCAGASYPRILHKSGTVAELNFKLRLIPYSLERMAKDRPRGGTSKSSQVFPVIQSLSRI